MAKDQSISIKDTVFQLQLSLLEGIKNENQLFAAGSVFSRRDYEDVVTERSIANLCGYPLCSNSLPGEQPRKGRYRISLKEHKVYDLHETYMFCSPACVVNSRAFAGTLQEERCSVLNIAKLDEILKLFGNLSLDSDEGLGENGDLGLSRLKIQENVEPKAGEVPVEKWIGPSNAIEGYVPQRVRNSKPLPSKNRKEGSDGNHSKQNTKESPFISEMDFMSTIITNDKYSISKTSSDLVDTAKEKEYCRGMEDQYAKSSALGRNLGEPKGKSKIILKDEHGIQEVPSVSKSCQNGLQTSIDEAEDGHADKAAGRNGSMLKPILKSSGAKKLSRSVTWADEKMDSSGSSNLCEIREMEDSKTHTEMFDSMELADNDDNMIRHAAAQACATALSQAAEVVASGEADVSEAVAQAGIMILPRAHDIDEGRCLEDVEMVESESGPLKQPRKSEISPFNLFDPEGSWTDAPPEGFSLTLSPFATMWMALFAWITSSSLAYIYGTDESFHEEYLSVNGREYPRKNVLGDGRSSEIKQTLAGCLARALPGLAADLRLPTPVSIVEKEMVLLLETMSFLDALPAFKMKQWQVIAFLFIEALSVCRIPALAQYMTNRRVLLRKVLDGAHIGAEEYEVMKDLIIPLGRAPQFSAQSGA